MVLAKRTAIAYRSVGFSQSPLLPPESMAIPTQLQDVLIFCRLFAELAHLTSRRCTFLECC